MALGFLVGAYHPVVTLRYFFHLKKKTKTDHLFYTDANTNTNKRHIIHVKKKKKKKSKTWQEGTSDRVELVYMRLSLSCTI